MTFVRCEDFGTDGYRLVSITVTDPSATATMEWGISTKDRLLYKSTEFNFGPEDVVAKTLCSQRPCSVMLRVSAGHLQPCLALALRRLRQDGS